MKIRNLAFRVDKISERFCAHMVIHGIWFSFYTGIDFLKAAINKHVKVTTFSENILYICNIVDTM